MASFNPTMVRLLLRALQHFQPQQPFQSHNGAIAAELATGWSTRYSNGFNPTMVRLLLVVTMKVMQGFLFQSHNGAIAAGDPRNIERVAASFNPTMVRLLHTTQGLCIKSIKRFNPTMVRLLLMH